MPTTAQPGVRKLRPGKGLVPRPAAEGAGAIIIGKANLSEFANSGFYSASAYGRSGTRSIPRNLDRIERRSAVAVAIQHGRLRPRHPDR